MVKNLSVTQEIVVQSLGQEDPMWKGMATTLVFLPEESYAQRSLESYSPWCCKKSYRTEQITLSFSLSLS